MLNWIDGTLFLAVYFCFTAYLVSLVRQQMNVREIQEYGSEIQELQPQQPRPRCRGHSAHT